MRMLAYMPTERNRVGRVLGRCRMVDAYDERVLDHAGVSAGNRARSRGG